MGKDSALDALIKIGLVAGSIWLGYEFLKALSEKCSNCGNSLTSGSNNCQKCGWFKI